MDSKLNRYKKSSYLPVLLIGILIIITTASIYWQTRNFDFVNYDDLSYVYNNKNIQTRLSIKSIKWAITSSYTASWQPLVWLSFLFEYQFHGLNPGWLHLTNVFFHIVNALLLFFVLKKMTGEVYQCAFVALMFALHPIHVESVAWITERKDVLCAFFWILTIWSYARYSEYACLHRYLLVLFFLSLGLMTKPMAVTLPFVFILLDLWPLGRIDLKNSEYKTRNPDLGTIDTPSSKPFNLCLDFCALIRKNLHIFLEKIPFFIPVISVSIITLLVSKYAIVIGSSASLSLYAKLANILYSYVKYIAKLFWPFNLAVFYPFPKTIFLWKILVAIIILLSVSIFSIRVLKKYPWFIVGWFWYIGTFIPVIGIIQVGNRAMADRFAYIPFIGAYIIIAWGIPKILSQWHFRRKGIVIILSILLPIIVTISLVQASYWQNSISLFRHALDVTKENHLAHNNLGTAIEKDKNNIKNNIEICIKHYSEAIRIDSNYSTYHLNLARLLALENRFAEANAHCIKALQLTPDYPEAYYITGKILADQNEYADAIIRLQQALQLKPDYLEAHCDIGNIFKRIGNFDESLSHFYQALQLDSDSAEVHYNIGVILEIKGQTEEAVKHYYEALKYKPTFANVHNNLGAIMFRGKRIDDAIRHYRIALKNKNDIPEIHKNLGDAFLYKNHIEDAIFHYKEAVRLRPGFKGIKDIIEKATQLQKKFNLKVEAIKNQIKRTPQDPELPYQLGNIYQQLGKPNNALVNFQKAYAINQNSLRFLNSLAITYADLKNYDQSIKYFKKMFEIKPEQNTISYNIACLYAMQKNTAQSIKWLKIAVKKGYKNWQLINNDKQLESIRNTSEFKKIIKAIDS